jgi:hypothetical protein
MPQFPGITLVTLLAVLQERTLELSKLPVGGNPEHLNKLLENIARLKAAIKARGTL